MYGLLSVGSGVSETSCGENSLLREHFTMDAMGNFTLKIHTMSYEDKTGETDMVKGLTDFIQTYYILQCAASLGRVVKAHLDHQPSLLLFSACISRSCACQQKTHGTTNQRALARFLYFMGPIKSSVDIISGSGGLLQNINVQTLMPPFTPHGSSLYRQQLSWQRVYELDEKDEAALLQN